MRTSHEKENRRHTTGQDLLKQDNKNEFKIHNRGKQHRSLPHNQLVGHELSFLGPLHPAAFRKDSGKSLDVLCTLQSNSFDLTSVLDKELDL